MELAGISFTTTLPAPMTEFLPMVTPGRIVEPLRAGINDGLMPVYEELSREREHLRSIIRIEGE